MLPPLPTSIQLVEWLDIPNKTLAAVSYFQEVQKSTLGFSLFLGPSLDFCRAKKKQTISVFSTEHNNCNLHIQLYIEMTFSLYIEMTFYLMHALNINCTRLHVIYRHNQNVMYCLKPRVSW